MVFQKVHSIKERLSDCTDCDTNNSLQRIPSIPMILTKEQGTSKRKVGSLVNEYIEEVKEELKEEKKELSSQVYKDD